MAGELAAGDLIATLAMPPRLPFAADAGAAGLVLLAEDGAVYRARLGATRRSVDPARTLSEARAGEVLARDAAEAALQVHGAIGYTAEHDLSLWLGKVRALIPAWGSQAEHRARVMAGLR